ncbi:hypothetical protein GALL_374600 [mine drainage metagenome]|uniref:DUF2065 domain-containing protein n=1 Tax=mine drainage metagenome TaxID=410659 RepID=A0A1J5QC55_9ZZZZ
MKNSLVMAFGLMLVLEGILPFLAPGIWRQTFQRMVALKDGQLRFVGIVSMLGGLVLLTIFA